MPELRLHGFLSRSRANGPGQRAVIWTAGCSLKCPGCFNPETHDAQNARLISIADLVTQIKTIEGIEGITISGGEPLQQPGQIIDLLRQLRAAAPQLSILMFTGYTWQEIERMPLSQQLPGLIDVVIAGRYLKDERIAARLIGSNNKEVRFFSDRYTMQDLDRVPTGEVIISSDGKITLTGINPLVWEPAVR